MEILVATNLKLDRITGFWTSLGAAELFWVVFGVAIVVGGVALWLRGGPHGPQAHLK